MKDGSEVAKAVLEILEQSNKENIVEAAKSAKSADIDIDVSKQISRFLPTFIYILIIFLFANYNTGFFCSHVL